MRKKAFHILNNVYRDHEIKDEFTLLGEMIVRTLTMLYLFYCKVQNKITSVRSVIEILL